MDKRMFNLPDPPTYTRAYGRFQPERHRVTMSQSYGSTQAATVSQSISQEFEIFFSTDPGQLTDNVHWGDVFKHKSDKSIRIYFQNVHGITSDNNWHKWEHSVVSMHQRQVEVCCFAETNIKWTENAHNRALKILKDQYIHSSLLTASCDDPSLTSIQTGGTCLGVTGKVVGMIGNKGSDPRGLGRWCYVQLNCRHKRKLVIIVSYRVGKSNTILGPYTVYSQQYRSLRRQDIDRSNPQKEFDTDLCTQMRQLRT